MADKKDDGTPDEPKARKVDVIEFKTAREAAKREGFEEGERGATERVNAILRDFEPHLEREGVRDLRAECIERGVSADDSRQALLDWLGANPKPGRSEREQDRAGHAPRADIETVREAGDKWLEGCQRWLEVKGGLITDSKEIREATKDNEFAGMKLDELARDYLVRQHVEMRNFRRLDIVGQAFTRAGMHGTSDFASLLENVASKALLIGYEENEETWRQIVRIGNLSDFKPASRVNISSFSDLEQVLENDEYKQGHMVDLKETIQLGKYGKLFNISREAIINDDLDGFTRIPRAMGRAADRNVGDIVYAVLTANAALNQDAVALFHAASHGNLAGSGAAISETTLDAARNAMQTQTSPAPATGETGATLNIRPRLLIVPSAIAMTAAKAVRTTTAPVQGTNTGDLTVNTFFNALDVVVEARLDADSTGAWYVSANPNLVDTIECAFLDGMQEPFLDSKDGWTMDGVEYKVRHEVAAAAMDFRGLYKNPGP